MHTMRIGIDMRMARTGEGIGRYVEKLVQYLALVDRQNEYFLLMESNSSFNGRMHLPSANFHNIPVKSPYYSVAEQTTFIKELRNLKLDLVHFASFNSPIFYPGRFVTTIHDVIHHAFPGKKKSRPIHRLAYRLVIGTAVKRAEQVIAVSESTKKQIQETLGVDPQKIAVIYEGVEPKLFEKRNEQEIAAVRQKYQITKPYLLFVGVWRQYKNLPRLAATFDILKERYKLDYQLVLAGKIDPFYPEIKGAVLGRKHASSIRVLGYVPEEDLPFLYQGASVFVLPSLMEGFGLIGVEAQASNAPVAASDIPVLREILGEGAVYFDPLNVENMAQQVKNLVEDHVFSQEIARKGKANARRFSWEDMARKTLEVYKQVI